MTDQTNAAKMQAFTEDLKAEGLFRYFETLKGSTGAVQLHHIIALKQALRQGPDVFAGVLAGLGVDSEVDRSKLARFLAAKLHAYSGELPISKPIPPATALASGDAWRATLSDPQGRLPEELVGEGDALEAQALQANDEAAAVAAELGWPDGMRIINNHMVEEHGGSIRDQGMYKDSNGFAYIHIAAEVERPRPFLGNSSAKNALLRDLKKTTDALKTAHSGEVQQANVFDAFIIPPGSKEGRRVIAEGAHDIHIAEFDTAVLIECPSVEAAQRVRQSPAFAELKALLDAKASYVHCIIGTNPKAIDDVDHDRDGVFLFNYFYAANVVGKGAAGVDILLGVWEYTAGWWTAKANLTNSRPILPLPGEPSQYSLINHCRWDKASDVFPHLMFRPSLDQFVLGNFTANDIMAMPVLYRLA